MNNKRFKKIIVCIFILASIIRMFYIMKTPYTEKQHDLDLSYILTIYEKGQLPQDNKGQHYHQPLHQIISAGFIKIGSLFIKDFNMLIESLQVVTLIYSILLLFVIYYILKELKLENKYVIYTMLVTALHPTLIILSGSINNDCLCVLLIMYSILKLIKWYKAPDMKNTILLAIVSGLTVMAKTNGAIIAIPIIFVFLTKMYKDIKNTKYKIKLLKKYIFMFFIFGCISLPIGLWYNIRNYILFNQPILYVLEPKNNLLYVGGHTLIERFAINFEEIFKIYCNPYTDYSIPTYIIKCSLYGEFRWGTQIIEKIFYSISIIFNIIFYIISLICIIKNIFTKNKENKVLKNALLLLFITNIVSYIIMNIKLPYGCSMDFRYIVPILFIQSLFVCFELQNQNKKYEKAEKITYITISFITYISFLLANAVILF